MPARPLLTFPDPRLRLKAAPIEEWGSPLYTLAEDLLDTLKAVSALGLTAPHLGVSSRLVVIRLQPDLPHVFYANPEIVWESPERASFDEGSVSMPGIVAPVERAKSIRLRYRDLDGMERQEEAEDFAAACLQHEIDQLDGVFWIDRLTRVRRERALKRYAKLQRGNP